MKKVIQFKFQKKFVVLIVILIPIILELLISSFVDLNWNKGVNMGRLKTAHDTPNFYGLITDIKIGVTHRNPPEALFSRTSDLKYVQICYSFRVYTTTRKTYPAENYQLYGIFSENQGNQGYDAAYKSHVVEIGPYWLVCVTMEPGAPQPWDTEGTQPNISMFAYSEFGLLIEDRKKLNKWQHPPYKLFDEMYDRYYFILEPEKLPDDYAIYKPGTSESIGTEVITIDELRSILGQDIENGFVLGRGE